MNVQHGGAFEAPGYDLRERIGGSEGADVWLAEQRALGRRVALKVLRGEAADAEQLARFEFETRTAAALLHPHIVPLLDSGTTADGRRYYAMPYLEAGDLTRRIPVTPADARRIGIALCDALWYAHGRNVVHRDIKPSNVLFDEDGRPMLADFGIATTIVGSRGLTMPGRTLGAARYISPEQARGEKVDPRADLYSLGIVLFEMLTGRPPYDAVDDVSLAASHADAPIPRVPVALSSWQSFFDRALAKSPADRFMSARTMGQALEMIDTAAAASTAAVVAPMVATPRERDSVVAGAAAGAALGGVSAHAAADDLPPLRAEAPSYVRTGEPARRGSRAAPIAVLLGIVALAAIAGYRLTREPDEAFEPVTVAPGTSASPDAPAPSAPASERESEPGEVVSATTAAPDRPAAAPATRAADAARAAIDGGDERAPVVASDDETAGLDRIEDATASEIADGADSEPDISDIAGPDDPVPARPLRGARDMADAAERLPDDGAGVGIDDGDADIGDDERGYDDDGRAGRDGDRFDARDAGDGSFDESDARGYGGQVPGERGDYSNDPAFAPDNWSPPLSTPDLSGPPRAQIAELDALIDDGRAWLEDERLRVEALQDRAPPDVAERALESFEADEQAFERWLDRIDALRTRIEREGR